MRTSPRWITIAMIIGASLALVAFAACGGGDDNSSSNTPNASNTASGSGDNGGSSNTAGATQTEPATGSASDVLDELANLGNDITAVTGKVTYNSTSEDGSTSTLTFYSKPPNSRIDSTESDGTSTAYIVTPGTTYICSSSDTTCIATPSASGDATGGLGLFGALFSPQYIDALVSAAQSQGIDVNKSNESIAGTDATCFSGSDPTDNSTGKFCFGDNGVLLYEENTDSSGTQKLEATAYSSDVPDSDFEPPYPVTTIPAIG